MTTKEKIDQALGVSCGKSMDQMLDELDVDSAQVTEALDGLDRAAGGAFDKVDQAAAALQRGVGAGALAIGDMTASLKEVEDMIGQTKLVFRHIVENITSSDLIDSELVHSAAALVESMHLNVAEFISLYKQKVKFVEKVKLMVLQQQQRIELAELKHRQNLELV